MLYYSISTKKASTRYGQVSKLFIPVDAGKPAVIVFAFIGLLDSQLFCAMFEATVYIFNLQVVYYLRAVELF